MELFQTRKLRGKVLVKKNEERDNRKTGKSVLYMLVQKEVRKMVPISSIFFCRSILVVHVVVHDP